MGSHNERDDRHANHADVRRVAEALRQTYSAERQRHLARQGHASQPARTPPTKPSLADLLNPSSTPGNGETDRNPAWAQLAVSLIEQQIDPAAFIYRNFEAVEPQVRPPWPGQLTTARAMTTYELGQAGAEQRVREALAREERTARRWLAHLTTDDAEEALIGLLLDDRVPLSPLFRYCLAVRAGSPRLLKVADEFDASAASQYRRDPGAYDRVWGPTWIPERFRRYRDLRTEGAIRHGT